MAVDMAARRAMARAEHGGGPAGRVRRAWRQVSPVAGDRVPDDELEGRVRVPGCPGWGGLEEDAAMASVACTEAVVVGVGRVGGGGGHEAADVDAVVLRREAAVAEEEAEHWWGAVVEVAESAAEDGVGDEMVPELADGAGADEGCWAVRWEAEQDLLDELICQRRRWWRHDASICCGCRRWSFAVLVGFYRGSAKL